MLSDDPVVITSLGGSAPVQAEGTVAGHPFYFRARHEHWSFAISEYPSVDPVDIQTGETGAKHGFFRESLYGTDRFAANYMLPAEAESIIRTCAAEYLSDRGAG